MGLGDDIRDVFEEIGTAVKIHTPSRTITGEFIKHSVNTRSSDPFHREFFIEAELPYDSPIEPSHIVEFVKTGQRYIAMTKTPDVFESEVTKWNSVFYKCNVSGELSRPSGENPYAYHTTQVFEAIKSDCYGLMTESNYGNKILRDQDIAEIEVLESFLYVPHSVGIRTGDRYTPVSGENYRVGIVKTRLYDETDVAVLHEDTR